MTTLSAATCGSSDLPQAWDKCERGSISKIDLNDRARIIEPVMPSRDRSDGRQGGFPDVLEGGGSRPGRWAFEIGDWIIGPLNSGHSANLLSSLPATCHDDSPVLGLRRTALVEF